MTHMLKVITTDSLYYIILSDSNTSVLAIFKLRLTYLKEKELFICLNHLSYHSFALKCQFFHKIFSNTIPIRLQDNSN
jgi:hypothetical protein